MRLGAWTEMAQWKRMRLTKQKQGRFRCATERCKSLDDSRSRDLNDTRGGKSRFLCLSPLECEKVGQARFGADILNGFTRHGEIFSDV